MTEITVTPLRQGLWKTEGKSEKTYTYREKEYPVVVPNHYHFNGASIPGIWPLLAGFSILFYTLGAPIPESLMWGALWAFLTRAWIPPIDGDYMKATAFHDRMTNEGTLANGDKPDPVGISRLGADVCFLRDLLEVRYDFPERKDGILKLIKWAFVLVPNWVLHYIRPYVMFAGVAAWGQIQRPFKFVYGKIDK